MLVDAWLGRRHAMGRKSFLFGALTLLSVLLFVSGAIFASVARSPAPWEIELGRYRAYQAIVSGSTVTVESSLRAKKPWEFDHTMSGMVLGDSVHYYTDIRYREMSRQDPDLSVAPPGNVVSYTLLGARVDYSPPVRIAGAGMDGRMPLPFPPTEVWCVLLDVQPLTEEAAPEHAIIFVAQHRDIYNADWLVHEGETAPFSPALVESLSRIGCDLISQP
jgi:hypothetical protein